MKTRWCCFNSFGKQLGFSGDRFSKDESVWKPNGFLVTEDPKGGS